MTRKDLDNAAGEATRGAGPAAPAHPQPRRSIFDLRAVAPLGPEEQRAKEDAMARALVFGAAPVRDARGWALEVDFIEANGEAVEPWKHDREHKRLYRRSQKLAKAAGQLIGQPGDREEWGKRLARQFYREGSDPEGAVRRGLFEAIWRFDHVYDSFTVPRRYGPHIIKTGRIAAVAEEARRKWQAEGLAPEDVFWVRNRRNTGLVLVAPNPDPKAPAVPVPEDVVQEELAPADTPAQDILSGQGAETVTGQADIEEAFEPFLPGDDFDIPTEAYDPRGFYRLEEGEDGAVFVFDPEAAAADARRRIDPRSLDDLTDGFIAVLDAGRDPDDPQWQQLARLAAEVLPGTGHVLSAREAYIAFKAASTAMQNGDWEEALLKGGEALFNTAGAVPALGDLLRLGKGAVRVANLLVQMGRISGARPMVAAIAQGADGLAPAVRKSKRQRGPVRTLERTPGGDEARRLLAVRQKALRRMPGGFFEQTAERAFTATGFPPRTAIDNTKRGLAGVDMAIGQALRGERGVVRDAMFRPGAGSITFYFGAPGNPRRQYRGGSGLSHIIAKHGPEVMQDVVETIAKGTHVLVNRDLGTKMIIQHGRRKAVLVLVEARTGTRGSWLLTGYEKGKPDINFDLSQLRRPIFFNPM